MNKYVRQDLVNFNPYHAPIKPYEIKIDANENPFPHHKDFKGYMSEWLVEKDHLTRYPDTDSNELRHKLGQHYNILKENIICGVGSDQIIDCIIKVFIEPGDTVLVPTPSFSMYKLSSILNHGQIVEVPLDNDFDYDVDLFIDTMTKEKPKLVFLCTPNNPTGCILSKEDTLRIVKHAECPVVVDEAYAEFSGTSVIDEINNYDNLIVVRTFSKSYGLAGLRTGYGIACEDMIEAINITKPPFNLSTFSQKASLFVLEHHDFYMKQVEELNKQRVLLVEQLIKLPTIEKVYNSGTNYVLVRVNNSLIPKLLEEQLILVRDYAPSGNLANCIRLSIGSEDENRRLMEVLKTIK